MIESVWSISKKPMALITMEEDKKRDAEMIEQQKKKNKKKKGNEVSARKKAAENEAILLEYSLLQIGKLLGICFGPHGANVIGLNISHSDTGGDFTKNLSGDGIEQAVYGFCRILNFDNIIEAL